MIRPGGRALAAAVATLLAAYGIGGAIGRSYPPPPAPRVASPAHLSPSVAAEPVRAGSPGDEGATARRVAWDQPVTGPGRPPLANSGSGPFGSRRLTGESYVALTFDDGPDPRWTPDVLQLLREHRVRATFCVVGELAEAHPDLVRAIVDDDHTLCNHSWWHDFALGSRPRGVIRDDLERTNAAIRAAAPEARVSYFRQPGGNWTARVIEVAEEMGMSSLHWDIDPQDWRQPGAGAIAALVTSAAREGSIVLLHDGGGERRGTVRALAAVLPALVGRVRLDALPPGVDPPWMHGRELPLKPGQI